MPAPPLCRIAVCVALALGLGGARNPTARPSAADLAASVARSRADAASRQARVIAAGREERAAHRRADDLRSRAVTAAARRHADEARAAGTGAEIDRLAAVHDASVARGASLDRALAQAVPALRRIRAAPFASLFAPGAPATGNALGVLAIEGLVAGIERRRAGLDAARATADEQATAMKGQRKRLAALHARQLAQAELIETGIETATRDENAAAAARLAAARDAADAAARTASLTAAIAAIEASERASALRAQAQARARAQAQAQTRTQLQARVAARRSGSRGRVDVAGNGGHGQAEAGPGLASAAGHGLVAPVAGPVVQRFGAPTDAGVSTGVSYAPPPGALVGAPCRGRIDFAAPFRSYGRMIIVDCGHSWRVVLAGLDRTDAAPGASVRAGQPIGRMPDFTPGSGVGAGRPTLYVQLRHGSQPVDPSIGPSIGQR